MASSSVLAFWLVSLVLIAVPGADWAFTLSECLGGRSAVLAASGLVVGYTAMTAVVAAGVGVLVAGSPVALTVLTISGGAYLTWLGARTFVRPSVPDTAVDVIARTDRGTFFKGIAVSGLNPKGLLIFLALLPQFTDQDAGWPLAAQLAALGIVFTSTCGAFYLCLGLLASNILRARPSTARMVSRIAGAAMAVLGTLLIVERLS